MTTVEKSKIELNEQILFSKNSSLFIGRIVECREKAIKVDFCWESVWSNGRVVVFNYTTWIPKSVIINDELGGLTVKTWFANNLKAESVFRIKPYYVEGEKTYFV